MEQGPKINKISTKEKVEKFAKRAMHVGALVTALAGPVHQIEAQTLPSKPTAEKSTEQIFSPRLRQILGNLPLYQEIKKNPDINLRIIEHKVGEGRAGLAGSFLPDESKTHFGGLLELSAFEALSLEDQKTYKTTIYHELVHVWQDYQMFLAITHGESANMPAWKVKFYQDKVGDLLEQKHIGDELEAYYKTVLFEFKEGKVDDSTYAGFFSYWMRAHRTDSYKNPEVKKMMDSMYQEIKDVTGVTIEEFMEKRKSKSEGDKKEKLMGEKKDRSKDNTRVVDSWTDNVKKFQDSKWYKKTGVFESKDKTVTFCVAEANSPMLQMAIDKAVEGAIGMLAKQFKIDVSELKKVVGSEIAERNREKDGVYIVRILIAVNTELLLGNN